MRNSATLGVGDQGGVLELSTAVIPRISVQIRTFPLSFLIPLQSLGVGVGKVSFGLVWFGLNHHSCASHFDKTCSVPFGQRSNLTADFSFYFREELFCEV